MVHTVSHNGTCRQSIVSLLIVLICCMMTVAALAEERLALDGAWQFRLDPDKVALREQWFNSVLPDMIQLPGSTAEQGYGDDITVDTKWIGHLHSKMWSEEDRFEKYRQPDNTKILFWLQPEKRYVGAAWYQKKVEIPESFRDKQITLSLERCHWETRLWVDGKPVGMRNSLSVPHTYDLSERLTPGPHTLTLCVDNTVKIDVGIDAHSVSDNTQTPWNGIVGELALIARDKVWIQDVQVYPDVKNKCAKVHVGLGNATGIAASGTLTLSATSSNRDGEHRPAGVEVPFTISEAEGGVEATYPLGDAVRLWNEFTPNVYSLEVALAGSAGDTQLTDSQAVDFGMREIAVEGTQFTLNGQTIFLRGTLECCIFPLTGYPPTDIESWLKVLRAAKAHGLNHLRFHSWCPPEAAFDAADQMGFIYQIECAAWAWLGRSKKTDEFIRAEGDRILQAYGNHPSFCLMAYGNEPAGRKQKDYLTGLLDYWKAKDTRRVYTGAAGWPLIPANEFHVTPKPRAHQWGEGLQSRFNAQHFDSTVDYRDFVAKYDVPVVSHEIGQWCVYPNLKEIEKYTGVMKAKNFEIFRDMLDENHMLDQADDFLMASGKLQALCYKEEIESALRTPGFGGFQLLDLHDFPGQGTALVGVLDPFWESKGYITAEEYNRFSGNTVPLARMKQCVYTTEERFHADIEIAHYGPAPLEQAVPYWAITDMDGKDIASGKLPTATIPLGHPFALGAIDLPLSDVAAPRQLLLRVGIEGTAIENDWDLWIYPAQQDATIPEAILIVETLTPEALDTLQRGGKVLLIPAPKTDKRVKEGKKGKERKAGKTGSVPPGFSPIFWNTFWTQQQPPHTLGILCDPANPALAKFPTEFHSNWQWWELIHTSQIMILDNLPTNLRPMVQVIDDWFTNRRLGLVFEAKVYDGSLLVCGIDLRTGLDTRPVARQMRESLLAYMDSVAFAAALVGEAERIGELFKEK